MHKVAKYKVCRRLGPGVYEKCQTEKFALAESRKSVRRGKRRRAPSNYAQQLLEKQRVRFTYGISEKQFRKYVNAAIKSKGVAAEHLFVLLESRLDNVIYKLGLAPTRRAARQMVSHGHILVNGKRMKVPSYNVDQKDVLSIREGSMNKVFFTNLDEQLKEHVTPVWLSHDIKKNEAKLIGEPLADQASLQFDLTSVIEFYSK